MKIKQMTRGQFFAMSSAPGDKKPSIIAKVCLLHYFFYVCVMTRAVHSIHDVVVVVVPPVLYLPHDAQHQLLLPGLPDDLHPEGKTQGSPVVCTPRR